ncbi:carboxymuconolactone decarboxylase family protein [Streptomyces achromogenes]|uniref:carboxymuconolactone decarboxylase family protein n=1 Tax=Streptomyces achromogenes TaxID=67255 RepID=UPI0012FEA0F8|nr:carboxymuconolactone decarboxylase family protein [Streptomyces achromogenes]
MTSEGSPDSGPVDPSAAYRIAAAVAGEEAVQRFIEALGPVGGHVADLVIDVVFGRLHGRPAMSHVEREMVTLAVIAALGGAEEQLTMHLRISHRLGIPPEKVIEIFTHTGAYAGFPRALSSVETAKAYYEEIGVLPLQQDR